jgi:hypothetical protein
VTYHPKQKLTDADKLLVSVAKNKTLSYRKASREVGWHHDANGNKRNLREGDKCIPFFAVTKGPKRLQYQWNDKYSIKESKTYKKLARKVGRVWRSFWERGGSPDKFVSKWCREYPEESKGRALEVVKDTARMSYEIEVRKELNRKKMKLSSKWPASQPGRPW